MSKQNQEPIEAENVEVNDKTDTDVMKDERSWVAKQIDNHPKGFVMFCTVTGALLGAGAVAGLSFLFGESAEPPAMPDVDIDPVSDVAADVLA